MQAHPVMLRPCQQLAVAARPEDNEVGWAAQSKPAVLRQPRGVCCRAAHRAWQGCKGPVQVRTPAALHGG